MSDKQIAKAATAGKRITFRFLSSNPYHEVAGYVVGMDDYHWMIASVLPEQDRTEDEKISISLVHKSRVDLIHIAIRKTLHLEPVAKEITLVGQGFWDHCDRTYNGH